MIVAPKNQKTEPIAIALAITTSANARAYRIWLLHLRKLAAALMPLARMKAAKTTSRTSFRVQAARARPIVAKTNATLYANCSIVMWPHGLQPRAADETSARQGFPPHERGKRTRFDSHSLIA